jgi:hypothetical protein
MRYHLSIHATSEPGSITTWIYADVSAMEATPEGLRTTVLWEKRREIFWDQGQDLSLRTTVGEALEFFCSHTGLSDPF